MGLPPTSTKGSGDSTPVTTFRIDAPNIPITHSGVIATIGTIPVAGGGTGATTFTDAGVLIGNGTGVIQVTTAGTAGQVLTSNGAGVDPTFQAAGGGGSNTLVESGFALANYGGSANQYGDLTSISLTAGTWVVSARVFSGNVGAVTCTLLIIGISTSSGNSFPEASNGATITQQYRTPINLANDNSNPMEMVNMVVSPGSTTTYYLKVYPETSAANLRFGGRMTAFKLI